jgi:hypothetical protein
MFMMKSEVVGRPSVMSNDLVQRVDHKILKDGASQFQNFQVNFHKISRIVLYGIITVRVDYHEFCTRWVPKLLAGGHETQRMASALTFLHRYHKDGDEYPSHIVRVTGDETWVSFVNAETEEQSKQWMQTHSPNKPKKFKHQKDYGNCFLGQERSADGEIRATRDSYFLM